MHLEIKPSWASLTASFLLLLSKALHDPALSTWEVLSLPKSFPIAELTSLLCHLNVPKPCLLQWPPPSTSSATRGSLSSPPSRLSSFPAYISGETRLWGKKTAGTLQCWKLHTHIYKQKQSVRSGLQPSLPPVTAFISHSFAKCLAQQAPILRGSRKYEEGVGGNSRENLALG